MKVFNFLMGSVNIEGYLVNLLALLFCCGAGLLIMTGTLEGWVNGE